LLLLGCLVGQLTACVPKVAPIAVVHGGGSTPAPAELTPIAPQADSQQQEKRVVSLYYRMQGEDLLARETRTIWLPKDRQLERVLIESLIEGPSAKVGTLRRFCTRHTTAFSVLAGGGAVRDAERNLFGEAAGCARTMGGRSDLAHRGADAS
ncbi:MAG: hypothetical protein RR482_09755, partial [Clostridia bacterium]